MTAAVESVGRSATTWRTAQRGAGALFTHAETLTLYSKVLSCSSLFSDWRKKRTSARRRSGRRTGSPERDAAFSVVIWVTWGETVPITNTSVREQRPDQVQLHLTRSFLLSVDLLINAASPELNFSDHFYKPKQFMNLVCVWRDREIDREKLYLKTLILYIFNKFL